MVVFDTNILISNCDPRLDPDSRVRLDGLLDTLEKSRTRVLIPTPVWTEFLCKAGKATDDYRKVIERSKTFRIVPFGERAAIECASMIEAALTAGDKRNQGKDWAKAKFDWQIVAIAKVEAARTIYTSDGGVRAKARREGLIALDIGDLAIPESARQHKLVLPDPLGDADAQRLAQNPAAGNF